MATPTVPSLHRPGLIPAFSAGLALPWKAWRLIRETPTLRRWSTLCAVITAFTLVLVGFTVFRYSDDALETLWTRPAGLARYVWDLVRFAIIVIGTAVCANTVPLLALAPLQDLLSESTEAACGSVSVTAPAGFVRGWWVAWGHTLQRIAALWAGHGLLLLLHFIPGAGSLVWSVAAVAWTAVWLAVEYVDVAAARHHVQLSVLLQALRRHGPLAWGFGLGLYILLWVPVLNFFLIPLAVVSGTQLYCGLLAAGTLPSPARTQLEPLPPRDGVPFGRKP